MFPKESDILSIKIHFLVFLTTFSLHMCIRAATATRGPKSDFLSSVE